jgi:predicted Rossmann fold flavoprotein
MYDVIVIGAGPAGLMASITASKKNKVLLLEKNEISGKKLLITGGGRCNVTNLKSNKDFLDEVNYNKKFLYSAINKFGPQDIYDYFIKHGVKLKEEEDNKIFPVSNRSSEILQCLIDELKKVEVRYHENVLNIKILDDIKEVTTNKGIYTCKNIIIATGGSSFKHTGSTGDNMVFARKIKQPVINLFPVETSLILDQDVSILAGTSFDNVTVKYLKKKESGNLIFTHKGISGSASIDTS